MTQASIIRKQITLFPSKCAWWNKLKLFGFMKQIASLRNKMVLLQQILC